MGGANQRWLVAIGVFWVLYVVYALTTPTEVQGVDQGKAALIRIGIATCWLAIAAGLLRARLQEARPASFLAAFLILLPVIWFSWFAFEGDKWVLAFFGLSLSYATINGFLCLTIQTTWRAALAGLLVATFQVGVDVIVHFLAGTARIH